MPSPWNKARFAGISRLLVSSLRSKAKRGVGESPLVVQPGFPTSLADFVVKNRSRLRKTPRCSTMAVLASEIVAAAAADDHEDDDDQLLSSPRAPPPVVDERRQHSPVAEKCGEMESLVGGEAPGNESFHGVLGSKALEDDGTQASPTVPKLLKVEGLDCLPQSKAARDGVDQCIPTSKAEKDEAFRASAPSKAPKTEARKGSPTAVAGRGEACGALSAPEEAERKVLGGGGSGGFMVVAKVAFIMLVLAVVSKKIAIAVSVLSFAILFAEFVGKRLIPLLGPCEKAKKSLGAISGSVMLADLTQTLGESTSSIRGGITSLLASIGEPDLGSFRPGRNWVSAAPVNAGSPAVETISPASDKGCVKIEGCQADQEASTANRKIKEKKNKKKKLFRNIVPNKFRGCKGVKGGKTEGKLEPAGVGQASPQKGIEEEAMEEDEEEEDDDDRAVDEKKDGGAEEEGLCLPIPAMARDAGLGKPAKGSSEHLVFFVLILCGLIGGRVVALFLTVLWYTLVSSARGLWRVWNSHRSLESVPDASTLKGLPTGSKE